MGMMVYMYRKAKAAGMITKQRSDRTLLQSTWFYTVEFDLVGILLIIFAFSLFFLPFSLNAYAPNGWKTGYIVAMLVLGILLFPVFETWEAKFAPVQFLPWSYLKNGTIVGSCLLYGVMFISIITWNGYFDSYLLVVYRQSVTHAGYSLNSFSLASSVFSPLVAWWISYSGNFKWTAYSGVPIVLLGTALLVPFRTPSTNPGVLAFTQVLVGIGTETAAITALYGLFGNFGSSIGFAIAGALRNNLLPAQLYDRLLEESKANATTIFGDIVVQMSISTAPLSTTPSSAHTPMSGGTSAALVITIFIRKNISVRKLEEERGKQTKGTVF